MKNAAYRVARAVALFVVIPLAFPVYSALASDAQKVASSKNVMPLSASSSLQAATLSDEQTYTKALTLKSNKDGRSYYSDGRLAKVRSEDELLVYTYQDEVDGVTLYRMDKDTNLHSIKQYQGGVLVAELDKDGNYLTYSSDGRVRQKVDGQTMEVYAYEYNLDDAGAVRQLLTYRSTARGDLLYSSTSYASEGGVDTVTENFEAGGYEITRNGLLVEKADEAGLVTKYSYEYNKKGVLVKQVGIRSDGTKTVVDPRKAPSKKPINFRSVLKAALRSALRPSENVTATTKNGMSYVFADGSLVSLSSATTGSVYHFFRGTLLETVSQGQYTIVRDRDGSYVRIYPDI